MSGSAVPAAVDALVGIFTGAGIAKLTVSDGPVYDPPGNYLAVGWDGSESPAAVTGTSTPQDVGLGHNYEIFDVACLLSFHEAVPTASQARADVFAAFATLDAALTADHTLGGVALMAQVAAYNLELVGVETGMTAFLRFAVRVQAWK